MFIGLCFFGTILRLWDGFAFWDAIGNASSFALQVCGLITLTFMICCQLNVITRDTFNKWIWHAWY